MILPKRLENVQESGIFSKEREFDMDAAANRSSYICGASAKVAKFVLFCVGVSLILKI